MFINKPSIVSYVVAGGSDVFPFEFKFYADSDIRVLRTPVGQVADDDDDLLAVTDYTITSNASKVGGDVTVTIALTDGDIVTVQRSLPITRKVEYTKRGSFTASNVNNDNDYQTYLILDQFALTETYLKVPVGNVGSGIDFTFPSPEASKLIGWTPSGLALENKTVGDNDVVINILNVDTISDLSTVDKTLYETVNVRGYNVVNDDGGGVFNLIGLNWVRQNRDNMSAVMLGADSNLIKDIDTIIESPLDGDSIIFDGYNANNDGGGGRFIYDSTKSEVNNGGTIIYGWVRQYDGIVNVKLFGASASIVNNSTAINNALLIKVEEIYDCQETINILEDTVLIGVTKNKSKLNFTDGAGTCVNIGTTSGSADIEIRNITISNTVDGAIADRTLVKLADYGEVKNITIDNCVLVNSTALKGDVISLVSEVSNITITNNSIFANPNPTIDVEHWYADQYCIVISTQSSNANSKNILVEANEINGGATAYGHTGVNFTTTGVRFINNIVSGQKFRGVVFYHGRDIVCTGNIFENVTALSSFATASSTDGDDGGVIWLDEYTEAGTNDVGLICSNNIVRHCIGNGIYAEELRASVISNNSISYLEKRVGDTFSKDWEFGAETNNYTSDGGHGIMLTAGMRAQNVISGNTVAWCEGHGIVANRVYSGHPEFANFNMSIVGNVISNNNQNGIAFEEHFEGSISIIDNVITGNGANDVTDTFSAISITSKNSTIVCPRVLISGNTIENGYSGYANNQYFGIFKDTNGGTLLVSNNNINTNGGVWVHSGNSALTKISENMLSGSRGTFIDGQSSTRNNLGFKTEYLSTASVTTSLAIGHGLHTTPRGAFATMKGDFSDIVIVSAIDATNVTIKIYKHDGTPQTSARAVSVYAWVDLIHDI